MPQKTSFPLEELLTLKERGKKDYVTTYKDKH